MNEKYLKAYNPTEYEAKIYKNWEDTGLFNPDVCVEKEICSKDSESFCVVLPPPNVTGILHIGHASMLAIEDCMIRFNRMQGKKTLWIPGTDHAGIATQSKVESIIYKKEKKTRHDLGRENFLKEVEKFAQESHDTIVNQVKVMGSSLDWSREAYTLDEERNLAVRTAFKRMYDDGLVYRGDRIVNWDPRMQSTVADDEIERVEKTEAFYYLKYGPFTIATVRPETKFGDKYVVVHPNDKRYQQYKHGDKIDLEWINGPITTTIIKDEAIDMEFGTGVMTITPWHDQTDFEIAERHGLDKEQIIDYNGKLLDIAGEFAGLHMNKARPLIINKLKEKGLVEKEDKNYTHNIAVNYRGGETIEPQIMRQWFINVNKKIKLSNSKINGMKSGQEVTLKELMTTVVKNGQIKILPDRFEKIYFNWIDNLRDWCISRQLWFGHQIPVWYKDEETYCGVDAPSGSGWTQDPDTLDTWFSSGLWTFSTLGWPNETKDLKTYHPTSVLETGHDILFFWVARMVLMSTYLLGEIPFHTVYLHGLVKDGEGRKMSKSTGDIIDPLDVVEKFGADALRMALLTGGGPGNDMPISEEKMKGFKHFANKMWNITRFILSNTENLNRLVKNLNEADTKIYEDFQETSKDITKDIENYRYYMAGEKLYHYVWHNLADVLLEESKSIISSDDFEKKISRQTLILNLWRDCLKLLHPFMPFITEEIWKDMPNKDSELLLISRWPD
jgi:valyl-tRNA synthetase